MGKLKAREEVKNKTDVALREMQLEMKERPVIINRAPVLHRYGVMAFWPQLTSSNTLEIPPLIVGGFGADFDGDAMQYHVPSQDEAVQESIDKLLPSRNLLAASDFDVHYLPSQDYVGGLWAASAKEDKLKPARVFKSKKDAMAAYKRGDIGAGQRVEIMGT
jgi:DNA-directed RNA polymerase subunit beta'